VRGCFGWADQNVTSGPAGSTALVPARMHRAAIPGYTAAGLAFLPHAQTEAPQARRAP